VSDEKGLIKVDDVNSLIGFLRQPAVKLAEALTGILVSESKDWKLSAGRLVQASIQWKLYSQIGKELKEYMEKGKINEDFLNDEQNKHSLNDILKFIDEDSPDEICFKAIKKLFFKSVFNNSTDQEKLLSYQFMKLCKELTSSEILVLKSVFEIHNNNFCEKLNENDKNIGSQDAEKWLEVVSISFLTNLVRVS
jgi:adenylate kinase family enzyme